MEKHSQRQDTAAVCFIFIWWWLAQYAHIFDQILLNIGSVKYAQKWVWKQDQLLLVSFLYLVATPSTCGWITVAGAWNVCFYVSLKSKWLDVDVIFWWLNVEIPVSTLNIQLSEDWRGRSYLRWSTFENPAFSITFNLFLVLRNNSGDFDRNCAYNKYTFPPFPLHFPPLFSFFLFTSLFSRLLLRQQIEGDFQNK